jgi:hypothetical protein
VVNVGGGVGYLIDLRPKGERDLPLTPADAAALAAVREGGGPGVTLHGTRGAARPTGPVVIDGEAVELDGDAK